MGDAGEGGGGAVALEVAVATGGLGHEAHIPDGAVAAGELEQGAVELVAAEADEQALGDGVDGGLVLLFVVLVNQCRNLAVLELEAGAGGGGAAVDGDGVVGEIGDVVGPDLEVFLEKFRPLELEAGGEAGGGGDGGVERIEPVEDHAVLDVVLVLGVVGEGAVGADGAAVVGDGAGGRAVDGQGDEAGVAGLGGLGIGDDLVAEGYGVGGGAGGLGDLDHVGAEELVGAVLAQFAEVFDDDAAGDVVGVELADAVGFFEPHGAELGGGLGVGIGGRGGADGDVFGGDGGGEDVAENRVYRDDAAARDGDARAVEAFFRPIKRAHGAAGRGRDGEGLVDENVAAVRAHGTGAPPDVHLAGLGGEDGPGVGAVVVGGVNAGIEGGDDDAAGVGDGLAGGVNQRAGEAFARAHGLGAPEIGGGGDGGAAGVDVAGWRDDAVAEEVARDAGGEGGADAGALEDDDGGGRVALGEDGGRGARAGGAGGLDQIGKLRGGGGLARGRAGAADRDAAGALAELVEHAALDLVLGLQGRGEYEREGAHERKGAEEAEEAHGE